MGWWRLERETLSRLGSALRAPRPGPTSRETSPAGRARSVLSECCTFLAPAILMERDSGERIAARFGGLGEDEVRFDLEPGSSPVRLRPLAACLVSFPHRSGAGVFIARVRRIDEPASSDACRQLVTDLPRDVACNELRSAERIATPQDCGLRVRLIGGGGAPVEVQPLDLSTGGVLIELECVGGPAVEAWSDLEVEMELGDERARVSARVERREGPRLALSFPKSLVDGRPAPPPELRQLTLALRAARRLRRREGTAPALGLRPSTGF